MNTELTKNQIFSRSFIGYISKNYSRMKTLSKKREMALPEFTKEEYSNWIKSQHNFEYLWNCWKESNYNTNNRPSVDRIDPTKGYIFENMQLLSWEDNRQKGRWEARTVPCRKNTSGTVGVKFNRANNKYSVSIIVNKIYYYLGVYTNKDKAISVRTEANEIVKKKGDLQKFAVSYKKIK